MGALRSAGCHYMLRLRASAAARCMRAQIQARLCCSPLQSAARAFVSSSLSANAASAAAATSTGGAPAPSSAPSSQSREDEIAPRIRLLPEADMLAATPLQRFYFVAHLFAMKDMRPEHQLSSDELAYESNLRPFTLAALRAPLLPESMSGRGRKMTIDDRRLLSRPRARDMCVLAQRYDEFIQQELPQFAGLEQAPSGGRNSVRLEEYVSATAMMLRLATENPVTDTPTDGTALSPSLDPLKLLQRTFANLASPASPFVRLEPAALHFRQMMAAVQVLAGVPARNSSDRVAFIRSLLDVLREERLPTLSGEAPGERLYDYASKHENFLRTLLYASLHTGDLVFAASFLPLVPHSAFTPHYLERDTSRLNKSRWKHTRMEVLRYMFAHFMAHCVARIHTRFSAECAKAGAATATHLPIPMQHDLTNATLESLLPGMHDIVELDKLQQASPALSSLPASTTSPLDVLFHAYRCLSASHIQITIAHYNLLLFGLTRVQIAHSPSVHKLIRELLDTVLREGVVQIDANTVRILLHYCMRSSQRDAPIPTEKLALMQLVLAEILRTPLALLTQAQQAEARSPKVDATLHEATLVTDPVTVRLIVQALFAHTRATVSSDADALASALQTWCSTLLTSLRSSGAVDLWIRVALTELTVLDAWSPLERFLAEQGSLFSSEHMQLLMESSSLKLFRQTDQWAHSTSMEASKAHMDASVPAVPALNNASATDAAPTVAAPPATDASAAPAASPLADSSASMSVSQFLVRWEAAKTALSASERRRFHLPALHGQGSGAEEHDAYVASEVSAAKYIIVHSRRQALERKVGADAPMDLSVQQRTFDFHLPATVLNAPNFSTGWLLMCSAWVQHLGEAEAIRRICSALSIVDQAADGSNAWRSKYPDPPPQSRASTATPQQSADAPASADTDESRSRWLRWVGVHYDEQDVKGAPAPADLPPAPPAKPSLLRNLIATPSAAIASTLTAPFRSAPTAAELLASPVPFKLHPQLLSSMLYAFTYFPHYRLVALPWLKLFRHFAPHLSLFDLTRLNPMLVKLFQCNDQSGPFFDMLRQHPLSSWPAHMRELSAVWDPLDTHMQARGRMLLLFLMQRTQETDAAGSVSSAVAQPALTIPQLVECLVPFLERMEKHGHGVELREWISMLEKAHRSAKRLIDPYIKRTQHANVAAVHRLHPTLRQDTALMRSRGLLTIDEIHTWKAKGLGQR